MCTSVILCMGGIFSGQVLKMPSLKVSPIAFYDYIYVQVFHIILQFSPPVLYNICTFIKGRNFDRQGFLYYSYYSYRAIGARTFCLNFLEWHFVWTFWSDILSACGAQMPPKPSLGERGRSPPSPSPPWIHHRPNVHVMLCCVPLQLTDRLIPCCFVVSAN